MGDRIALIREGSVAFTRSGFAAVQWDDGERTTEWIPDLTRSWPEGRFDGYDTRGDGRFGGRR